MVVNGKGRWSKIFLLVLMIHLAVMSKGMVRAENNGLNGPKERISTRIKTKERGFITTDHYRFLLAESIKIVDIEGKTIPFYQLPVPVDARIVFQPVPNGYPQALEIIIQKEIIFRSLPE